MHGLSQPDNIVMACTRFIYGYVLWLIESGSNICPASYTKLYITQIWLFASHTGWKCGWERQGRIGTSQQMHSYLTISLNKHDIKTGPHPPKSAIREPSLTEVFVQATEII